MSARIWKYAFAMTVASLAAAQAETVRMGTEGAYPPLTFFQDDQLVGFDIDIGDEICARANLDCEWVVHEWDTIIEGLLNKEYDTILAGMAATPTRRETIAFSIGFDPNTEGNQYAGPVEIPLDQAVIATQSNTIQEEYLLSLGLQILTTVTFAEAFVAVAEGRADLAFAGEDIVRIEIHDVYPNFSIFGDGIVIKSGDEAVGFRKEDTELRAIFDEQIKAMFKDGTINELRLKWFGPADEN